MPRTACTPDHRHVHPRLRLLDVRDLGPRLRGGFAYLPYWCLSTLYARGDTEPPLCFSATWTARPLVRRARRRDRRATRGEGSTSRRRGGGGKEGKRSWRSSCRDNSTQLTTILPQVREVARIAAIADAFAGAARRLDAPPAARRPLTSLLPVTALAAGIWLSETRRAVPLWRAKLAAHPGCGCCVGIALEHARAATVRRRRRRRRAARCSRSPAAERARRHGAGGDTLQRRRAARARGGGTGP